MPAHTPSTVPTLNLSALQSMRRGGGSSVNSSRSSSTSTTGSGSRRRDGAGDKKVFDRTSEAAGWNDTSLQSEWSFDSSKGRKPSLSHTHTSEPCGWLVEQGGRDARCAEGKIAPRKSMGNVSVVNSRVSNLEGSSRMLAREVQDLVAEALTNDIKTQEALAVSQIATVRSEC